MSDQKHRGFMQFPAWAFRFFLSTYRPYRGAGIKMSYLSPDSRVAEMRLKPKFSNRNAFGTHFGGSLYSMCDPILVLMLARIMGPGYVLWDKSAAIRFKKPGKGIVTARFELPPEITDDLKNRADAGEIINPEFTVYVKDKEGDVVAEVNKILYVRHKSTKRPDKKTS